MIRHHPSPSTLTAYAGGTLAEGLALVVATHLGFCHECQANVLLAEAVGGALLDDLEPALLAMTDPGQVLQRVTPGAAVQGTSLQDAPAWDDPALGRAPLVHPELPAPLNRWRMGLWRSIGAGLQWRRLQVSGNAWAALLQVAPGRAMPRHGHRGLELACLIQGAFIDDGLRYSAGDVAEPDTHHVHQPRADTDAPCLCVIASEGVRMPGMVGLAMSVMGL